MRFGHAGNINPWWQRPRPVFVNLFAIKLFDASLWSIPASAVVSSWFCSWRMLSLSLPTWSLIGSSIVNQWHLMTKLMAPARFCWDFFACQEFSRVWWHFFRRRPHGEDSNLTRHWLPKCHDPWCWHWCWQNQQWETPFPRLAHESIVATSQKNNGCCHCALLRQVCHKQLQHVLLCLAKFKLVCQMCDTRLHFAQDQQVGSRTIETMNGLGSIQDVLVLATRWGLKRLQSGKVNIVHTFATFGIDQDPGKCGTSVCTCVVSLGACWHVGEKTHVTKKRNESEIKALHSFFVQKRLPAAYDSMTHSSNLQLAS